MVDLTRSRASLFRRALNVVRGGLRALGDGDHLFRLKARGNSPLEGRVTVVGRVLGWANLLQRAGRFLGYTGRNANVHEESP